jgi:N-acetyl-gamma-glutamyl-phosphate reductase
MQQEAQARRSWTENTHFSWRSNNMSHYKAFEHQHLGEINQSVNQLQLIYKWIDFVPNRGDFARGILPALYNCRRKFGSCATKYQDYKDQFCNVTTTNINMVNKINK